MVLLSNMGFKPVSEGKRYFISYKREDAERVGRIALQLHEMGVPLWYDGGIKGGVVWEKKISSEIAICDSLILLATRELFLDEHTFVHTEYKLARELHKPVCVIWLDPVNAKKMRLKNGVHGL